MTSQHTRFTSPRTAYERFEGLTINLALQVCLRMCMESSWTLTRSGMKLTMLEVPPKRSTVLSKLLYYFRFYFVCIRIYRREVEACCVTVIFACL